jgi:hypothetical protein
MTTNAPSRPDFPLDEPPAPRSLGTLAAALVSCGHPEKSHVHLAVDPAAGEATATWCRACGALRSHGPPTTSWQAPSLASHLTRKLFEDVVLLLHAVLQLTQLARGQGSPGALGSSSQVFLRNVRASLSEVARLPVVRDVDRLEEAIRALPPSIVRS